MEFLGNWPSQMGAADNAHVVLSTVDRGVSSKYAVGRDLLKF